MFIKYQHIERINTDETEGILDDICYVFPKLDGTNASVWLEDGELHCGSRKRELSLDNDNRGFMKYVMDNKEKYMSFFEKCPDWILYGEWLVPHTIKYRKDAYNKFYVFDAVKMNDDKKEYMYYDEYSILLDLAEIDYIPCIASGIDLTQEKIDYIKGISDFLAIEKGEGIVIKRYDYINKYGHVKWAKCINNEVMNKKKEFIKSMSTSGEVEKAIIDKYITEEFVLKEKSKLEGEWVSKRLGELLGKIWHEFVIEETWHFIKDHRNPTIDFNILKKLCDNKVKEYLGF